jgi:hypothetical protein
MQHHMEDFGEDLDGVKRRFSELDKADKLMAATACPRVKVPPASQAASTAVLANKGVPLLDKPPPLFDKPSHGGQMFHTTPSSPHQDMEPFKVQPPKHDFPRFSGETPMLWISPLFYFSIPFPAVDFGCRDPIIDRTLHQHTKYFLEKKLED